MALYASEAPPHSKSCLPQMPPSKSTGISKPKAGNPVWKKKTLGFFFFPLKKPIHYFYNFKRDF